MKASGDLVTSTPPSQNRAWRGPRVIGRSGDQKNELTAETRSGGEETSEHLATETPRHGEEREVSDAGLYQGTGFSRAVKDKKTWALASENFKKIMRTTRAALREIFDESAYDRFLLRTHAAPSVASYRDFMRERDAAMLKRPRCC